MKKWQYFDTGVDGDRDAYGINWAAQTFTIETKHVIGKVKLKLFRVGSPGDVKISIKGTTGGEPAGADLCYNTIDGNDLTIDTTGEWVEITLGDGATLEKGIQYAIVIKAVDGDALNKVSWIADLSGPIYTGGQNWLSSDSGDSWGGFIDVDCYFEEWGVGEPAPATITWQELPKSQISSETIEVAIARILADHNTDPSAHAESGESIWTHKQQEIIDHLAESIVDDKIGEGEISQKRLSGTEVQLWLAFESLDGWTDTTQDGSATCGILSARLETANVTDAYVSLLTYSAFPVNMPDFTKEVSFQTAVQAEDETDYTAYWFTGYTAGVDGEEGFGFKITNGTLYAMTVTSVGGVTSEHLTEITGIAIDERHIYRGKVSGGKAYFYIDGVLKHTEETYVPSTKQDRIFTYYIANDDTNGRKLYANYLLFSQE